MMKRIVWFFLSLTVFIVIPFIVPQTTRIAHAQQTGGSDLDAGLESVGTVVDLPATDPRVIAARIINIVLGLLAIIMVVIMVYAGFLYMTAGGNAEQTQTAIAWIRNAIIGLIIILSSWAIARYVITSLLKATGGGGGGGVTGTGSGGGGGFTGSGGSRVFKIKSVTPSGSVETRKVIVKILFSQNVEPTSLQTPGAIVVERVSDGAAVAGSLEVRGKAVHFTPSAPCPEPNTDRFCFDANTDFRVRATTQVKSTDDQNLVCGGFAPECEGLFRTGAMVDVEDPSIQVTYPVDGFPVPSDSLVDVNAYASDNVAISYVTFQEGGTPIGEDAPTQTSPKSYDAHIQWDTVGLPIGEIRTLTATAYDVDSGRAESEAVRVIIRAPHCFDGTQNEGETDVDCGGDPASLDYCGACTGGLCQTNTECSSGVCTNGVCVEQPIITGVDPLEGAPGTYVTIRGVNFGSNGTVSFLGSGTPVQAIIPEACQAAGVSTWSPRSVIVEVPAGAESGPLQITNNESALSDRTDTLPNPYINHFVVNDQIRPGICAVVPASGVPGTAFTLHGTRFGSTSAGVTFGQQTLSSRAWSDSEIQSSIPNTQVGSYPVSVTVNGAQSNIVGVRVHRPDEGDPPEILEITPATGPIGTYVTLRGRNFGSRTGSVFFVSQRTDETALADTDFPEACADGYWSDQSIVVKVPRAFTQGGTGNVDPGSYAVYARTARATAPESNRVSFSVNTDALAPGICRVEPRVGPTGTDVVIHGENFTGGPGNVTFYQNRLGETRDWGNRSISTRIPTGAVTGPMIVRPQSTNTDSNPYTIEVRNCNESALVCTDAEECCADGTCRAPGECPATGGSAMYAWQISTGIIPVAPRVVEECKEGSLPSPAPWSERPGGTDACVNEVLLMVFTTKIDSTTVSVGSGNVLLNECTAVGDDGEKACETVTPGRIRRITHGVATNDRDYIEVQPEALKTNTWYQVVLRTGVSGPQPEGKNMQEDERACGEGNAYCYTFKTRADANPCEIGSIEVVPDPYRAYEQHTEIPYSAKPKPVGDICRVLSCDQYAWSWTASDPRASVTSKPHEEPTIGGLSCRQTVTAIGETGPSDPVQIVAEANAVAGQGDLFIQFVPPVVQSFGPDCDTACVNAAVWAELNVPLDPESITNGNVRIERCANEACRELLSPPTVSLPQSGIKLSAIPGTSQTEGRFLIIEPYQEVNGEHLSLLTPGSFYRVVLVGGREGGIVSTSNVPLSGLNHPDGFSWQFRVKPGSDSFCEPERVTVAPEEKYESLVGSSQGFLAVPFSIPDTCSVKGQVLMALGGYQWESRDTQIAQLYLAGAVDTGPNLPLGCTETCLMTGAAGPAGKTARCGNGIIETTNASYCSRAISRGGSCTVLDADGAGGEECDDGNVINGDGCNSLCLFDPVNTISEGGTCGNGTLDDAEDCDFGRTCRGATSTSGIADDSDCTAPGLATACTNAGGKCQTRITRGCSLNCRHLGSNAGGVSCGNADVSDGEDCDDGNRANGDGCSSNCLHEGSKSNVFSLCGNGILESGESCERSSGGSWPVTWCDPSTCMNRGSIPCEQSSDTNCCGNHLVELGEDCDEVNGGCSATCLRRGSSATYETPSFCGDGIPGIGEFPQCELPPSEGDGNIDAFQVATIRGAGEPIDGLMSTEIVATYMGKTGQATYGLRCGFTDESMCLNEEEDETLDISVMGLSSKGCCSLRPQMVASAPAANETDVCRNVLIHGSFNTLMDEASISNNFLVAEEVDGTCPEGSSQVGLLQEGPRGLKRIALQIWKAFMRIFGVDVAVAQTVVLCSGQVSGVVNFDRGVRLVDPNVPNTGEEYTTWAFTLDAALKSQTTYHVIFVGDTETRESTTTSSVAGLSNNGPTANKRGIRSESGVVRAQDIVWSFTTGDEICMLNAIEVTDRYEPSPNVWLKSNEMHPFTAYARSIRNGTSVSISPTNAYSWAWQPWTLSNARIATLASTTAPVPVDVSVSTNAITSTNISGSGYLTARVRITADTASPVSSVGQVIQGVSPTVVNVCENPWPSQMQAPFRDEESSPSLTDTSFEQGPFFNFSTMYCRDAGDVGPNGDLPALFINAIPDNPTDRAQGILRQYLLTFTDSELKKDAIGIRIATNPLHLSPMEWYRARGFTGSPEELTIDGYQAVRDGRTVYISGASTEGPGEDIYSNIYIISYNNDAEPVTREIYDALLDSMMFNRNIESGVSGQCVDAFDSLVLGTDGKPVACSADFECDVFGDSNRCENFKAKLQRDLIRLGDFQRMSRALEEAKKRDARYPELRNGSYLPGRTTSLWPSWEAAFGEVVYPNGGNLPKDPINRFVTCGRCSQSNASCVTAADCPRSGELCTAIEGFSSETCWNAEKLQYRCAVKNPETNEPSSRLYSYRAFQTGQRYELAAEFEVPPPDPSDITQDWWQPPLFTEVNECQNPGAFGQFCVSDEGCSVGGVVVSGSCRPVGGQYRFTNVCSGELYGQSSTCGDGIVNSDPSELTCFGGANDGKVCTSASGCPGGSCDPKEICEMTGEGSTRFEACSIEQNGASVAGMKRQICSGCREWIDDVNQPGCFSINQCGNGRVDGVCTNDPSKSCVTASDCSGGASCKREVCDDGSLNGTYGHCNLQCNGFGGLCGDGQISLGEQCDLGFDGRNRDNGQYCKFGQGCTNPFDGKQSCSLSCTIPSTYCGDGIVTAPNESCDGNSETASEGLFEIMNPRDQIFGECTSDCDAKLVNCQSMEDGVCTFRTIRAACAPSRVCIGAGGWCSKNHATKCVQDAECEALDRGVCEILTGKVCSSASDCGAAMCSETTVPTVRSRTCNPPSNNDNACSWGAWDASCHAEQYCGNGTKEGQEECDDGNDSNFDGCSNYCTKNVCGDGFLYEDVEECDNGSLNGQACSSAEYGSTCSSCSNQCRFQLTQGGFCGDGIKSPGSAEQCDTAGDPEKNVNDPDINANVTCRQLGYDYALSQSGSRDKVTCTQSCAFTGCGYCGERPESIPENDPNYNGTFSGMLKDVLFQQPVPNARVTLFYRGLQVAMTMSDGSGKFSFSGLDAHTNCGQYRIVIDSYIDNPLTEIYDESIRQGYMPIEIGPFQPSQTSFSTNVKSTNKGQVVNNVTEIFMLPRLRENEYVVQLWWEPKGGYDNILAEFNVTQNADNQQDGLDLCMKEDAFGAQIVVPCSEVGTETSQNPYQAIYDKYENELHDLVIRTPYTFSPGTYGRCTLSDKQEEYNPNTTYDRPSNTIARHGRNLNQYLIPSNPYGGPPHIATSAEETTSSSDSWVWRAGIEGIDHVDPVRGMLTCTNKVRATFSKTCAIEMKDGSVQPIEGGRLGCANDSDCTNPGTKWDLYNTVEIDWTTMNGIKCIGQSEPERTGKPDVLEGAEGAYLFCFHPEDPGRGSDCGNFVLPPQSAFIVARSGQYDIMVSKYRLFLDSLAHSPFSQYYDKTASQIYNNDTSYIGNNERRIKEWMALRKAKILIYDQLGLSQTISAPPTSTWNTKKYETNLHRTNYLQSNLSSVYGWNWCDNCNYILNESLSYATNTRQVSQYYYQKIFPRFYSPVWTPASIKSNEGVSVWYGGDFGADYRYFSDLMHSDTWYYLQPAGEGMNEYRTCAAQADSRVGFVPNFISIYGTDNNGDGDKYDEADSQKAAIGKGLCNGPAYMGPNDVTTSTACTSADQVACPSEWPCSKNAPSDSGRCIKLCTQDSDCQPYSSTVRTNFCVPLMGTCTNDWWGDACLNDADCRANRTNVDKKAECKVLGSCSKNLDARCMKDEHCTIGGENYGPCLIKGGGCGSGGYAAGR